MSRTYHNVEWYISFKDVELAQKENGGKNLDKTLHSLGMDVKQGYMDDGRWKQAPTGTTDVDDFAFFHRSLSGDRVCGPRYMGVARQDGRWRSLISNELNLQAEFGHSAGAGV